jgi:GT2 family glycosyltransferase
MTSRWIIMPFVDNLEMTQAALQDCLAQSLPDVAVLLIDQGSTPENHERVWEWQDPRVYLWTHQPPLLSLAATWNQALRFVWEQGNHEALVVNNDVRLAPWTYELLLEAQQKTVAWFISAVSVQQQAQLDLYLEQGRAQATRSLGEVTESRKDGVRPEGYSYGGPDFSCYLITQECHRWFQFDESFIPAYHEDNDYHRRLQLAGFGDKIFGVNLPFLHYGSATINRSEKAKAAWAPKFAACQAYYVSKWGGLPGHETFTYPFDANHFEGTGMDPRTLYFGQGRGELGIGRYRETQEALYRGQET